MFFLSDVIQAVEGGCRNDFERLLFVNCLSEQKAQYDQTLRHFTENDQIACKYGENILLQKSSLQGFNCFLLCITHSGITSLRDALLVSLDHIRSRNDNQKYTKHPASRLLF